MWSAAAPGNKQNVKEFADSVLNSEDRQRLWGGLTVLICYGSVSILILKP